MESQLRHLPMDVRLAPIGPGHAEAMYRWLSDPDLAGAVGVHGEITLEGTERWIARATADDSLRPFAIYAAERHVGNVILDLIDRGVGSARLSIYLGEADARGAGVGAAAVQAALARAFGELALFKVWLIVHNRNTAAIAAYERCGFSVEGTLRGEFVLGGERVDALRMAAFADRAGAP